MTTITITPDTTPIELAAAIDTIQNSCVLPIVSIAGKELDDVFFIGEALALVLQDKSREYQAEVENLLQPTHYKWIKTFANRNRCFPSIDVKSN
jgi:hypothetical protein